MDALSFTTLAKHFTHRAGNYESHEAAREFKEMFGVSAAVCAHSWAYIITHFDIASVDKPIHMLWALVFLFQYPSERYMSSSTKADEKTARKYVWPILRELMQMAIDTVSACRSRHGRFVVVVVVAAIINTLVLSTHTMYCSVCFSLMLHRLT